MTKYIGPKTDGENVATQADKLSLSSETPDALTPDQTGAAGTATTAARSDHQHEILAASAGTITGTNAEGTSTSFARADHNHAYGALSIPNSALALGPTYETSLPGSPVDGQEIYYAANATDSVIWHLRYRSAARSNSGAWEYIGGQGLFASTTTNSNRTNTAYGDLAAGAGPTVNIPLTGDYFMAFGALLGAPSTSFQTGYVSPGRTAAAPGNDDDAAGSFNLNGEDLSFSVAREILKTSVTGNEDWKLYYRSTGGEIFAGLRWFKVTPRRVWIP